jgi:lysyl-tRNA synthetase class 2
MIPSASFAALQQRAELLHRLREFFRDRGFLEVETPLVLEEVIPELHIEPLRLENGLFLQASPELAMKCLLAAGAQAIFQVTHSFRAGERGQLHNPEFTIVEWYRVGDDMTAGMDLIDEMMQGLLSVPPAIRTSRGGTIKMTIIDLMIFD